MEAFYKKALNFGLVITIFSSSVALVEYGLVCKTQTDCAEDRVFARLYRIEHGIKTEEEIRDEQLRGQRAEEVKH